jgi:predicted DNA-binding transcriptional regulator AlpA
MDAAQPSNENLVTISGLVSMLQRSRASIYRDVKSGSFPRPLKIGASSRWRLSEVQVSGLGRSHRPSPPRPLRGKVDLW